MHIISTTSLAVKVVPRSFPTDEITVSARDEETRKEWSFTVPLDDFTVTDNFLQFTFEGTEAIPITNTSFYTFRVKLGSGSEIYRGKIFCTNQTNFEKYTTIDNTYTETESSSSQKYQFR